MEESAATSAAYEPVSLMVATGTGTPDYTKKAVNAYPVNSNVTYHLIDKADKLIVSVPSTSSELALPDEWVSPLVSEYQYYSTSGYDSGTETYTPTGTITSPFEVGSGGDIYVTYTVNNNAIDLDGRNSLGIEGKENKTYMLRYLNGDSFYQENGEDDVMDGSDTRPAELRKAVYPYSNGDAALYVYGPERWNLQLASGASTRSRWLWLIEPANSPVTTADLDPYHIYISSYQPQTNLKEGDVVIRNHHSYFHTYQPDGYDKIITGVTNDNPLTTGGAASDPADKSTATEYMILGTLSNSRLVTLHPVALDSDHDGTPESNERRTINSFEMYWKNNPTVQGNASHTPMPIPSKFSAGNQVTTVGRNVTLNSSQKTDIQNKGWHVYEEWANSQPWVNNGDEPATTGKKYLKEEHVFQTINMGESFVFEAVTLAPQVILLDQHGWEIMRVPLSNTTKLGQYNSPMVYEYQWYATASKVPGYHKYIVSGEPSHTSSSLSVTPSGDTDFYVTYTVKSLYANAYQGAATEDAVTATPYLLKQGGSYATYGGSGTTIGTVATKPSRESLTNNIEWYLKPNFNIDREMGYKYAGETGAQDDALSQPATEAANYDEGRNGFDPYNVQIQNRAYPLRYFTANTTGSALSAGLWTGTSGTVAMQNMSTKQTAAGYDQTTLNITNATFMVVDDGAGNMRLMPRFDHSKVMQSFGTLATQTAAAAANDAGTGTQTLYLESVAEAQIVYSSDEITDPNGYYLLAESFEFVNEHLPLGSAGSPFTGSFTGIIDGQLHTISSTLTKPLVNTADGAIIRNVILESVNIDETGNVGAIANEATGATRIYNCGILSGTVSGSGYTGGLVGWLKETTTDGARVINCYSYADIKGGTDKGGIVGYNNYATNKNYLRTMVMNCMFYGDIVSGGNIAPIYAGKNISNKDDTGVGNFNYFRAEAPYAVNQLVNVNNGNSALMAETRFLQRFEFFRHLLNGHRELAAWWATGDAANKDQMAKWVFEPSQIGSEHPYPILKTPGKYPSVVNFDADNAPTTSERNKGGKLGTLAVTIVMDDGEKFEKPEGAAITTSSLTLNITDKDPEHFNFNYYKVQLPYYNDVGTKNYTGNRVVTGWKITSITGGKAGTFSVPANDNTPADAPYYNYADRNCTNKDLYSVSGRIFNQGDYWDVPEGVTAITIKPYWAKAAYVADDYRDVVFNTGMDTKKYVGTVAGGQWFTNNTDVTFTFKGEPLTLRVYSTISSAVSALSINNSYTVNDYAVVLVGNYHHYNGSNNSALGGSKVPYTFTSVDFDEDNEPDYSLIMRFNGRAVTHPVKYDFLCMPGFGMAQKSTGGQGSYNFGILKPDGWFEVTNTALFRVTQMEYSPSSRAKKPIILHGGVIEQWVSSQGAANSAGDAGDRTSYFHMGDNVWFKEFHIGVHQDYKNPTPHPPVSVTGGDYDEFYLTGLYRADATNYNDNAECYINGGRFGIVAGAAASRGKLTMPTWTSSMVAALTLPSLYRATSVPPLAIAM